MLRERAQSCFKKGNLDLIFLNRWSNSTRKSVSEERKHESFQYLWAHQSKLIPHNSQYELSLLSYRQSRLGFILCVLTKRLWWGDASMSRWASSLFLLLLSCCLFVKPPGDPKINLNQLHTITCENLKVPDLTFEVEKCSFVFSWTLFYSYLLISFRGPPVTHDH